MKRCKNSLANPALSPFNPSFLSLQSSAYSYPIKYAIFLPLDIENRRSILNMSIEGRWLSSGFSISASCKGRTGSRYAGALGKFSYPCACCAPTGQTRSPDSLYDCSLSNIAYPAATELWICLGIRVASSLSRL